MSKKESNPRPSAKIIRERPWPPPPPPPPSYPNKRDCEHGYLARSCEICERDKEIAELTRKLNEAGIKHAQLENDYDKQVERCLELEAELAQYRAIKATIAASTAREAVEVAVGFLLGKAAQQKARPAPGRIRKARRLTEGSGAQHKGAPDGT